jgi:hypothetical protein
VLIVTAAAALVVMYLLRTMGGPDATERPVERARVPRSARGASNPGPAAALAARNVFEYADGEARPAAPVPNMAAVAPPVIPGLVQPPPAPSPLVRLVGLVRRGAQTRVALALAGDTIVLGAGESASGYTVISIDEEEGVRLRAPDGSTIVLVVARDQ